MADGAVNFILDKLTTILTQQASLLGDAHDKLEEVKLELESMRSFLRDAERRKDMSESVETWVRQVREVAYEVEDIMDEYLHLRQRGRAKNGVKGMAQNVVNFPKDMRSRHRVSSKLEKVIAKVHEVSERSKRYGFQQLDERNTGNGAGNIWQHHGESSAFEDEDKIVGMEEDTELLLRWLMDGEPRRSIRSLVGMGGVGKTTLASRVYNHPASRRRFDCCAWISVSQAYGIGEIVRSLIKELFFSSSQVSMPSNLESMNYRQLVGILIEYLHQKSYMVVLDDVWSIDLWSIIRGSFPDNRNGSRIILTTRDENVAASIGVGSHIHRLRPLQDKDAWDLFCKRAFWNDPGDCCPKELQPMAKAILKKCDGLPLAIVAIGGLLCSRGKRPAEWKKVHESINWQISNNPVLERLKGILLLSFNDLPFYLRHCFLYCCLFHDGYPIKRKKLIRLWVAEGFIKERKEMTMEEVAEEYLNELILRSMIQDAEKNDAGRVKKCRVHDVMRELALSASEKENFCTVHEDHREKIDAKIQRLSLYNKGEAIRLSSSTWHHLRTLFVIPTDTCSPFSLAAVSSKFRLLRVLNLEGVPLERIPSTLVELFNLTYLNLRNTKIGKIPEAIGKLYNLQTLDVRNTNLEKLPSGISRLYKLRHLLMLRCNNQNSQATHVCNGMQVPPGICYITTLQTLAWVTAEQDIIQQIGNLRDLKRLEITKLRAADGTVLCSSIKRMTGLISLGVIAVTETEELQLEALPEPLLSLQKLTMVGKLLRLPPWIQSLESLTHLHLRFSCLEEDIPSSIHALASLVVLELSAACIETFLHFKSGFFPKLSKLILQDLSQLDNIMLEEGSLPSIREWQLARCEQLKALPTGIEHLTSLQRLHLEEMPPELMQRFRVPEDQAKVRHIPTINLVYFTGENRIVETI